MIYNIRNIHCGITFNIEINNSNIDNVNSITFI